MAKGETFAYLSVPKIPPEDLIGDYLQSKMEITGLRNYLQWDVPRRDPIMNLVSARRNLHKAELQLTEKKNDAQERRKQLDLQWDELREDAEKLKKTFCEFDEMITENVQKRERAIKKTKSQKILQTERDKAIEEFRVEYGKLIKIKDKMEYQLKNHKIYEDFLQTVADAHPEYNSPKSVFNKFGALDEARNALTKRLDEYLTALENTKNEMLQLNMKQSSILIGVNNRVAELYNRYATAKSDAQKWEEIVKHIQVQSKDSLLEILKVGKACWQIYSDICERKKAKPQLDKMDFENQLVEIKTTMLRLKKTLDVAREKGTVDISSVRAESPRSKRRI